MLLCVQLGVLEFDFLNALKLFILVLHGIQFCLNCVFVLLLVGRPEGVVLGLLVIVLGLNVIELSWWQRKAGSSLCFGVTLVYLSLSILNDLPGVESPRSDARKSDSCASPLTEVST